MDLENDRLRLVVTHSSDRGGTWSKPKPVDAAPPAYASQFQPMIAVNSDGVLGVFFYDTDGHPKRDQFDVSFAASVDGGETFLPKKRLSNDSSSPFGPGNVRPGPIVQTDRGMFTTYFVSGVSRWPDGGDYIGLTADSRGVFHPFWADARSGTYQLYTAAIRVPLEAPAAAPAAERTEAALTDRVTLLFDPVLFDAQSREVRVPVRIKNVSKETLYPPFRLEIEEARPSVQRQVEGGDERSGDPELLQREDGSRSGLRLFEDARRSRLAPSGRRHERPRLEAQGLFERQDGLLHRVRRHRFHREEKGVEVISTAAPPSAVRIPPSPGAPPRSRCWRCSAPSGRSPPGFPPRRPRPPRPRSPPLRRASRSDRTSWSAGTATSHTSKRTSPRTRSAPRTSSEA